MTAYFVGVDGGGTRTRLVILDVTGRVVGYGQGGPSNYDDVGIDAAGDNIAQALEQARAGLPADAPFAASFFGMAGVTSAADHEAIRTIARRMGLTENVGVDHDIRIALAGGLSGRPGIALIAGTGSSVFGRNAEGQSWRAGGWGHIIGDEGSSYWLGVQAMRAAVMAFDGRLDSTLLQQTVPAQLGVDHMDEIMHRIYVQTFTRADVASLAPLVIDAAQAGDAHGLSLIAQAAEDLAECVRAAASRLRIPAPEICAVGGLLSAGPVFTEPLFAAVHRRLPDACIVSPEMPPVMGAGLLALMQTDAPLALGVVARLRAEADRLKAVS
jgi:glucosamine kinase